MLNQISNIISQRNIIALVLFFLSCLNSFAWRSIEIICPDSIRMQFNISDDMQIGLAGENLSINSRYYDVEIPQKEVSELRFSHDIVEDHSYIPESPAPLPDETEDPAEEEYPGDGNDDNENPGDGNDDKENPEREEPSEKDPETEIPETPDIATGLNETENEIILFENERILLSPAAEVMIFNSSGLNVSILKNCSEIILSDLPSGVYILSINGRQFKIAK